MLTASHLGFRYAGVPVLHDVNLHAEPASMTAVTGANGSGKSTLLHLLAGITAPAEGAVRRGPGVRVALLPQRTSEIDALPLTVAECVRIGRFTPGGLLRRLTGQDRATVTGLMERLDIAHLARRRLRELSGGQRQRVLIAQTFAQDAGVLILDEPTAALDTTSRRSIHDLLTDRVREGAAVIIATHDDEEAALAGGTLHLTAAEGL
ncbi:putative ABC transporter ATP-binding protein [Actinoplanes missouriensis 431]|uniref:Putative ABC transporter ATP-binding protein n=1 Tax=Actinoplanes missouriensis (strain ATCC 14538 / DSM 43046 / CBS 188.64 / JCM 3121 / NBRC 102363 / NCIMB 12654 / NRRL B-3342 / UNCC 431) TaxID=512565 RepID=I0H4T9_ACTM4|nr:zinc ABC transporter ATP-binding protein AztA [Actinoplanes missouriensis]BAL88026.1 putative ABC transporter ATP-binding protein [Actinoplanes missouriensis 431]